MQRQTRTMTLTKARDRASKMRIHIRRRLRRQRYRVAKSGCVSWHPTSCVQDVIAVVCCQRILPEPVFLHAIDELIRFTLLQDAYGQHTSVFRTAYLTSAAIALLLGVPAAIVLFRNRLHYMRNQADNTSAGKTDAKAD